MSFVLYIGVGLGFACGVVASLYVSRRVLAAILRADSLAAAQRRLIMRMAVAGGVVGLLPSLLLGTVVGGTLGGFYASALTSSIGMGRSGAVLGTAVGVFAVVALVMCGAVVAGAWLGRFLARGDEDAT